MVESSSALNPQGDFNKIEIIRLIQDIFSDEEELNNFLEHIEYNNDKEQAEILIQNLYKLLNY